MIGCALDFTHYHRKNTASITVKVLQDKKGWGGTERKGYTIDPLGPSIDTNNKTDLD